VGERGPAPDSAKLKLMRGTARKDRPGVMPNQATHDRPRIPSDMSDRAKQIWRRVLVEVPAELGQITGADFALLRIFAEAVDRGEYAAKMLQESGPLIRAGGTGARRGELVKNPLHQVVRDNATLAIAAAKELLMTPAARARAARPAEDEADPFETFLEEATG